MEPKKKRALFLDRDGVIISDTHYLHKVADIRFVEGIFNLCRFFSSKGFLIICCTNQSGIARGFYSQQEMQEVHTFISQTFKSKGITLESIYVCPHGPNEKCNCRKPNPGMFLSAVKDFDLDPRECYSIGDKSTDTLAAQRAKVGHIYQIKSEHTNYEGDFASIIDLYHYLREEEPI